MDDDQEDVVPEQGTLASRQGHIPVAFPSGKTCHIIRAVDAWNLEREWTWISDDRRPQVWKRDYRKLATAISLTKKIMPPG